MHKNIAITPVHICDASIAIGASRAGELGILDIGAGSRSDVITAQIERLRSLAGKDGNWGVRWDIHGSAENLGDRFAGMFSGRAPLLVLAGLPASVFARAKKEIGDKVDRIFLEVLDLATARSAEKTGYDGVIVKGCEAGGRVGRRSSFILLQEFHKTLSIPYWIQGGMGMHTAAAAQLAGAAGVVLAEQLWLTDEGPLSHAQKQFWAKADGSETTLIEQDGVGYRFHTWTGREKLRELEASEKSEDRQVRMEQALANPDNILLPLGQDISFASGLAERYGTVGLVFTALRSHCQDSLNQARLSRSLAENSPLAVEHTTRYPIVQGPMARVSDVVPFAAAVADGGGLPIFGIAVTRNPELHTLLSEAKKSLTDKPWGVGMLGFLPRAFLQEQMAVVKEVRPSFAVLAGGRLSQAKELEEYGVSTYLHVPSVGLLTRFLGEGGRKFIFEGSEGGGHIGARTSFCLWELGVEALVSAKIPDPEDVQVLFAGGVHDSLSAAMVAVLAAPLTQRGMKIGVLMGSAYLFTEEAVNTGAIVREYQEQALACEKTVTLQSKIGQASRCAPTPYCDFFTKTREELRASSKESEKIFEELERLNIGRLHLAAKGMRYIPSSEREDRDPRYTPVDRAVQQQEGMYMLGEIASFHSDTMTVATLHETVSLGGTALTDALGDQAVVGAGDELREDIAIIGMAGMFPGADDIRSFWANIINGVNTIREVDNERWRADVYFDPNRLAPDKVYSKWGGFLGDMQFDPTRYGMPPATIKSIEPIQLLALETARLALKDAGLDRRPFPRERTAVIFGVGGVQELAISYGVRTLLPHVLPWVDGLPKETREMIITDLHGKLTEWSEDSFPGMLDNVVAGRIANRLNLQGSNFSVDAACASSMAAFDVGISQLRSGTADVALVGAVDGANSILSFMCFSKTQALSPRGRCAPFDNDADGLSLGEGVAAMVIKRLGDAERDGDRIYSVIKGIGSSSDGRSLSMTAPHPKGQVLAINRALRDAGVDPRTVELVEAHGTGTAVGDKAEIKALNQAFGDAHKLGQYCAVGSVKSMIGHTKVSAGMASMLKATLALNNKVLPRTIGVKTPNTHVDFTTSPFYVNTETRPWFSPAEHPRRCGVSSFGFGGTNFHLILEEYRKNTRPSDEIDFFPRNAEFFCLSRGNREEMFGAVEQLLGRLRYPDGIDFSRFAYAHHQEQGRNATFGDNSCRLAVVVGSMAELVEKMQFVLAHPDQLAGEELPDGVFYREGGKEPGKVCFLFPGQGSQKVDMLRDLVVGMPELQGVFEKADQFLADRLDRPLSRYIYPLPVFSNQERARQQQELSDTRIAQPALGAVDLAALTLLDLFGIKPDCVAGHSYGEYVALCAAGIITEEELLHLSEVRGRAVAEAAEKTPGAMAAVQADEAKVCELVEQLGLSVIPANMNAPDQTVVSGSSEEVAAAVSGFMEHGLIARKIPVSCAFHSPAMAGAGEVLARELNSVTFRAPKCRVYSNTLGDVYPEAPEDARTLLVRHLTEPVRFADQIRKIHDDGARIFIEVGPGQVLSGLVGRILAGKNYKMFQVEKEGRENLAQVATLLGQAWVEGVDVCLEKWFAGRGFEPLNMNEVLEQARSKAEPGPLVWRVNGGRAVPWNKKHAPATSHKKGVSDEGGASVQDNDPAHMLENNMARFSAMQQQQMEQFLATQQQILKAVQEGRSPAEIDSGIFAENGTNLSDVLPVSPPAPGLPSFKVAPSAKIPAHLHVSSPEERAGDTGISKGAFGHKTSIKKAAADFTREEFQVELLNAVSERTGYPPEMLDLDAHMEADLGIDSIKRIEIILRMAERYGMMGLLDDEESFLEEMASLQTLREVIDGYKEKRDAIIAGDIVAGSDKRGDEQGNASLSVNRQVNLAGAGHKGPVDVGRYLLRTKPLDTPAEGDQLNCDEDGFFLLVGRDVPLVEHLLNKLGGAGLAVRHIVPAAKNGVLAKDRLEANLVNNDSVQALPELLGVSKGKVAGLIYFTGADVKNESRDQAEDSVYALFNLLKVFGSDLRTGMLVTITAMNGRFGVELETALDISGAGSLGFTKAMAREWQDLRVQCIDVAPDIDPAQATERILSEMRAVDPPLEVGLTAQGRIGLELVREQTAPGRDEPVLDSDSVVLVTGGGYGITAEVTKELAGKYQPHLVLVGRSPLPGPESEATASLADDELRSFFISEAQRENSSSTPVEIERLVNGVVRNRAIRNTIQEMEEVGSVVEYRAVDVSDSQAFGRLIDDLYSAHGRINGFIHGAGISADGLFKDKSVESFAAVYETKVASAKVLAEKIRPQGLEFAVFFSSITGRLGNVGQCDYSAANEYLNKIADLLSHQWPDTHVLAMDWGPWELGLVNRELLALYAFKNILSIPVRTGTELFLKELQQGKGEAVEIVYTASLAEITAWLAGDSA